MSDPGGLIGGGAGAVLRLGRHLASQAPWPMAKALGLMTLANLTEGVSILLLVPIVKMIGPGRAITVATGPLAGWLGPRLTIGLGVVLAAFVAALALRAALTRYKDLYTTALLYDFINRLRNALFASVAQARWQFLVTQRGSDINHALTADIDRVHAAAFQTLQLAQVAIMLAVYAAVAVTIAPKMSLIAGLVGLALIGIMTPIRRIALRYGASLTGQRQEQYRIISEFLNGVKVAKSANAEPIFVARLAETLGAMRHGTLRFMRLYTLGGLVFQIASAASLAGFVYLAVARYGMAPAEIVALIFLFIRVAPQFTSVHGTIQGILTNIPALDAMLQLKRTCDRHAEPASAAAGAAPRALREIAFRDVAFAYASGEDRPTLRDLSFTIPARQVTAIIGPSGSGKSTIADILMGLLEPQAGALVIDGVPLDPALRRAWRAQLAYIPQDSFLMHDTIAANLAFGERGIDEAAMWDALRTANAERFVRALPLGLATVVGDRGLRLSGGERQRVALARALLRRPSVLLLDEATSALDWENQALIAAAIDGLRGRMTVVTIAHRPSMIAFADWVVAIEDGQVVETGPYADLAQAGDSRLRRTLVGEA